MSLFGVGGRFKDSRLAILADYIVQTTRFGNAFTSQVAWSLPL